MWVAVFGFDEEGNCFRGGDDGTVTRVVFRPWIVVVVFVGVFPFALSSVTSRVHEMIPLCNEGWDLNVNVACKRRACWRLYNKVTYLGSSNVRVEILL